MTDTQKGIKVAIFGGSFDPPHIGHVRIVNRALSELDIDKLFVVPTYLNPFKKSFQAPARLRYQWLKRLFEKYKKVEVLDFEIRQNRPVATIETVKYLYEKYNIAKLYLIIGADNAKKLSNWKNYEDLKNRVQFVIATREGYDIEENLIKLEISANISSTKLRKEMDRDYLPSSLKKEIIKFYKEKNG